MRKVAGWFAWAVAIVMFLAVSFSATGFSNFIPAMLSLWNADPRNEGVATADYLMAQFETWAYGKIG